MEVVEGDGVVEIKMLKMFLLLMPALWMIAVRCPIIL
jgi:hypothetical protein